MKRFILMSFVLMGWAFYVMSGGSEFDPSEIKAARIAAAQEDRAAKGAPARASVIDPAPVIVTEAPRVVVDAATQDATLRTADADVTRVALNLTSLDTVIDRAEAAAAPTIAPAQTVFSDQGETAVPQNVRLVTSSADTPAIIPSLINPNDGQVAASTVPVGADGALDIRAVSGDRVNVRGGPGTGFEVVGKMVRGDQIEVLEDNGAGWVRFQSVDGTTQGWLADFLLSGG